MPKLEHLEATPPADAPSAVLELVGRFEQQLDSYKSGQYNETQLRREFLDPLFKTLGWDMDNEQGYAEAYKDVIHEDAIHIGGATQGARLLLPHRRHAQILPRSQETFRRIKDEPTPAYQLRRYAWSAKLPLSILSDFEEFAVYDCRIQTGQGRFAGDRPYPLLHVSELRREMGVSSPPSSPATPFSKVPSTNLPNRPNASGARRRWMRPF